MRLIDADKLLENSFKNPISYNAFCNLVKRQPTVDAVPVSWIMAQVEERKERGTAFDLSVASTLRTMVKEWKDETD